MLEYRQDGDKRKWRVCRLSEQRDAHLEPVTVIDLGEKTPIYEYDQPNLQNTNFIFHFSSSSNKKADSLGVSLISSRLAPNLFFELSNKDEYNFGYYVESLENFIKPQRSAGLKGKRLKS